MREGAAAWFDLPVADAVDAMAFYEGLLGWTFVRMQEPAQEGYWMIQNGNALIGGLREIPEGPAVEAPNGPVLYFTVSSLESSVRRAKELGASLAGPRVDLGKGRGSYQWMRDRQKNLIALWAAE